MLNPLENGKLNLVCLCVAQMSHQVAKNKQPHDHIPPHRAWTYIHADSEFTMREHDHILECEQCLRLFILCLRTESFGAVLKELREVPHDEPPAA